MPGCLFHDYLVSKYPTTELFSGLCLIAYISSLCVSYPRDVREFNRVFFGYFKGLMFQLGEVNSVIGNRNRDRCGQEYFRAYHLHKGCGNGMDGSFGFHINRYIQTFAVDKALPTTVTISPIATYAVRQGGVSLSRIVEAVRSVVNHFLSQSKVSGSFGRFRATADFVFKVERMVAFCLQIQYGFQSAGMEVRP